MYPEFELFRPQGIQLAPHVIMSLSLALAEGLVLNITLTTNEMKIENKLATHQTRTLFKSHVVTSFLPVTLQIFDPVMFE
jgi:hypothetical protein